MPTIDALVGGSNDRESFVGSHDNSLQLNVCVLLAFLVQVGTTMWVTVCGAFSMQYSLFSCLKLMLGVFNVVLSYTDVMFCFIYIDEFFSCLLPWW